ncbi:MAG: LPXTG cell wall anchor domain-containing protein, partial [Atopobiaceae bacterium]|nr:LPXTG cell wall anchor domain-containing protein [Atopobiaceae bacterium]MCH4276945.1 LPXTG cell wall anchor domain-containing protein [Atopobiaceae bacterium]
PTSPAATTASETPAADGSAEATTGAVAPVAKATTPQTGDATDTTASLAMGAVGLALVWLAVRRRVRG